MPYRLTWEKKGLLIEHLKTLTLSEIEEINTELFSHPGYDTLYYQLIDLRGVESFQITEMDFKILGAMESAGALSLRVNRMRIGIIAEDTPEFQNLIQSYHAMLNQQKLEYRFFQDMAPAREWAMEHVP
jgi:hypothetical protein